MSKPNFFYRAYALPTNTQTMYCSLTNHKQLNNNLAVSLNCYVFFHKNTSRIIWKSVKAFVHLYIIKINNK